MRLFFLSILSFFFLASSSLAISKLSFFNGERKEQEKDFVLSSQTEKLPPIPTFVSKSNFPEVTAQGLLISDLNSGITLYEKNPDSQLFPASTTKIVTALVAMDYYHPDEILTAGKEVFIDGQKMNLLPGERIKVKDLLYGLLVFSANDAAEVLANNYPGGKDAFVSAMNLKAKELYLENSIFFNPSGLDGTGQVTTARDLLRAASFAMEMPLFREIVGTKKTTVYSVDGKVSHRLFNINELLGEVEGVIGVKTGWTPNSKENLVTYVERDKRRVIIVVLGSQDRFGETKKLIDWVFTNYEWREVD